jgi:hypothetical protein
MPDDDRREDDDHCRDDIADFLEDLLSCQDARLASGLGDSPIRHRRSNVRDRPAGEDRTGPESRPGAA